MAALGWTPATVMQAATLQDLSDALHGYMQIKGIAPQATPPAATFLRDMLAQFPDRKTVKDDMR